MHALKYLAGCRPHIQARVHELILQGQLGAMLADRYGRQHSVRNDSQLYAYVQALKDRHLHKSVPSGKMIYDSKLQVMKHALGGGAGYHLRRLPSYAELRCEWICGRRRLDPASSPKSITTLPRCCAAAKCR
jgi:hypothetical protein